jgi:hypothetical protein
MELRNHFLFLLYVQGHEVAYDTPSLEYNLYFAREGRSLYFDVTDRCERIVSETSVLSETK